MDNHGVEEAARVATFGRRKLTPRVCVADGKQHIRAFLAETLEELGFVTCECMQASQLGAVVDAQLPDLVVLGLSAGGVAAGEMLNALALKEFAGKVLLLGPVDSSVVAAVRELGESLGIAMLPTLVTPFGADHLRERVAGFLPIQAPPSTAVDATEAVRAGWLELWYQPKINTRTLALREAEALIRLRHPTWGIVPPAYFMANDGDPHLRGVSEFVVGRAIDDWRYFVSQHAPIGIAINLPIDFLHDPDAVRSLCLQMPDHPAFEGMIIEISGAEVIRNLELVKDVAKQLQYHNIAISIDDLGEDWPSLVGQDRFPFVEIKVDRRLIAGCSDDRLKRAACRQILDLADGYGARTVAEGVETRSDFIAVREMGFDLAEGFLFAKPMTAKKFARTMLGRPVPMPS
jgi:EAL domain-containing protein (putative c-di-GMP-specific phosphodiesterase class I)